MGIFTAIKDKFTKPTIKISSNAYDAIKDLLVLKSKYKIEYIFPISSQNYISDVAEGTEIDDDFFLGIAKTINKPDSICIRFQKDASKGRMCIDTEFTDILKNHGYYLTYGNFKFDTDVYLEPCISSVKTNYVKEKCGNILYHITKKENVESILENGIELASEENANGNISKRKYNMPKAFFVVVDKYANVNEAIDSAKKEFYDGKYDSESEFVKIDLNKAKTKIELFEDTEMSKNFIGSSSVYSIVRIPKECISKIS